MMMLATLREVIIQLSQNTNVSRRGAEFAERKKRHLFGTLISANPR